MDKRKLIALMLTASVLLTSSSVPFNNRVNLHGGEFPTKSMSVWELYKYKYTTLLRKDPLCWEPYKAYLLVDKHVQVTEKNNRNYLVIDTDLINAIKADADYNKAHAIRYKGTPKEKVRKIYKYCMRTNYVIHVKYARNVFQDREGDCAAIASAFYVLCKKNKIPVRYCIGWAEGSCHAWNMVKLGKKWYHVDATLGRYLWRPIYDGYTLMECW